MFLSGRSLLLSALTLLLSFYNLLCETKSYKEHKDLLDLMYSDTSHGETTAEAAQQQVVFIDHGGGAVSHIRRTSYIQPKPQIVPSVPFRPHPNHYPNSLYENSFADEPYFNYHEDIPRVFERRAGETTPKPIAPEPQAPPSIPFIAPEIHSQQPPHSEIDDEKFRFIHNEIERIPRPSKPTHSAIQTHPIQPIQPTYPTYPTHQQISNSPPVNPINPFLNFAQPPELFPNFESPFEGFGPQISPLFQRRRLTTNNNIQDFNQNSIGYPSYDYYKGGDENPSLTNWPKIFKFTDGRANLFEFEKMKKHNKIKFNSKETYFDNISRDSFLILHGGAFTQ